MITSITGVVLDGTTPTTSEQEQQELTVPEGEHSEIDLLVVGEDYDPEAESPTPFDLTGYELFLCVRRSSQVDPLFTRQGSIVSAEDGTAKFVVTSADTDSQKGNYYYDVFIIETATSKGYRVVPKSRFVVADSMFDVDDDVTAPGPGVALVGLPAGATEGQVVTADAEGLPVWASPTGGFSNTAVKTSAYTAVARDRVLADASSGDFNIDPPATPTEGDTFSVANVAATGIVTVVGTVIGDYELDPYGTATFIYCNSLWMVF